MHVSADSNSLKLEIHYLKQVINDKCAIIAPQQEVIHSLKEQINLTNQVNKLQTTLSKSSAKTPSSGLGDMFANKSKHQRTFTADKRDSKIANKNGKHPAAPLADNITPITTKYSDCVKITSATNEPQMTTKRPPSTNIPTEVAIVSANTPVQDASPKRVNRRRNVIIGKSKTDEIKTVPKMGYLHVFRLFPTESAESLLGFLKKSAPLIQFSCEQLIQKNNSSASFKVSFPMSNVEEV
ncbi:hypothetical protein PPYR_07649 [Photinus pyralis]|uniref:Uncharacterized protein n=1 Tax=Photinus pyralis TaxID=7054 RepID=A0A5N4AR34_PHOPY|nr:hypothetical protein PPYR_07612 [Photinus pyralis]KAB0799769.1 hypothetical protein PPYR_07649 [Photinus pyralis]